MIIVAHWNRAGRVLLFRISNATIMLTISRWNIRNNILLSAHTSSSVRITL